MKKSVLFLCLLISTSPALALQAERYLPQANTEIQTLLSEGASLAKNNQVVTGSKVDFLGQTTFEANQALLKICLNQGGSFQSCKEESLVPSLKGQKTADLSFSIDLGNKDTFMTCEALRYQGGEDDFADTLEYARDFNPNLKGNRFVIAYCQLHPTSMSVIGGDGAGVISYNY